MKIRKLTYSGGSETAVVNIESRTFSVPVSARRDPLEAGEVSNKSYIDNQYAMISGDNFTSGTVHKNRMPAWSGDVIKSESSDVVNLSTGTAVSNGAVLLASEVGANGVVMGTSALTKEDIPNFSWGKISLSKPTTVAGWGITDALLKSGGTVNGPVHMESLVGVDYSLANHAVTRHKTDESLDSMAYVYGPYRVGALRRRCDNITMSGYLKCNGASVSKTIFGGLYLVVGDAYNNVFQPGSGQPWAQQYTINSAGSTDITGWTNATAMPQAYSYHQVIVTKNRVYVLARYGIPVYTAVINADGTLGAWKAAPSLPSAMGNSQLITTKNRVYLMHTLGVPNVYTAPINSDGTLGTWTYVNNAPLAAACATSFATKSMVYVLGGFVDTSSTQTAIQYAPINADGTLGAWTVSSAVLPVTLGYAVHAVIGNKVYILGGYQNGYFNSVIYVATIDNNGLLGSWTQAGNLPFRYGYGHVVVTSMYVFLIGGFHNDSQTAKVYRGRINADLTIGTWTEVTSLPAAVAIGRCAVIKNKVYLFGGRRNDASIADVICGNFSGGSTDYSPYYNGTITSTPDGMFTLPDFTSLESKGVYTYIKT